MNNFLSYLKNVRTELSHVVWPNWRQGVLHTVLIMVISAVAALYLSGLDYVFTNIVSTIVSE
jgi:preprotein translocase SecE subunit